MEKMQKITLQVPQKLLESTMKLTKQGITPTVQRALEKLLASYAYEEVRKLRGKIKFNIDLKSSREDRL